MPWKSSVLVVANVTADSPELLAAMRARGEREPTAFHLLVPRQAVGPRGLREAQERLTAALALARAAGLEIEGELGDPDPLIAVSETYEPRRFDEIIVSTLPTGVSKWLSIDLPQRIRRMTAVGVTHIVTAPPKSTARSEPAPIHARPGPLAPLNVLSWTGERSGHPRTPGHAH
jgi:hypothetical protein